MLIELRKKEEKERKVWINLWWVNFEWKNKENEKIGGKLKEKEKEKHLW